MAREPRRPGRGARRRFSIWTLLAPAAFVVVVVLVIMAITSVNFHTSSPGSASTSSTSTTTALPAKIATANHYVVKNGDTLGSIAQQYDLSVTQLEDCNNIVDSHSVNPGTYLNVGAKCRKAVPADTAG